MGSFRLRELPKMARPTGPSLIFTASNGVRSRTATRFVKNGYLAVCIVNSGVIAAATQNEVHWLRVRGALCDCVSTTVFNLPVRPVALVGGSKVDEVIAIFEDGAAACLQRPKNTNSAV